MDYLSLDAFQIVWGFIYRYYIDQLSENKANNNLLFKKTKPIPNINSSFVHPSILQTWSPWYPSVLNIEEWYSLPLPEARGALGTVPSQFHTTSITSPLIIWLFFSVSSSCLPSFRPSIS